ncbi:MAG: (2Fe-2S)-binding protein [Eubacteriales bacterium]|jgi:carbon-monoxide dehydrogenase small subunit
MLNGQQKSITANPLGRLIDLLRNDFQLTGTKEGCGEGKCGACAVLLDNRLVNSCLVAVAMLEGRDIITIEGYRETEKFSILKESFEKAGSVQCGFCTPGMILAAEALLSLNPNPSEEEARISLEGNLCRCTGYNMIIDAVLSASKEGKGLW